MTSRFYGRSRGKRLFVALAFGLMLAFLAFSFTTPSPVHALTVCPTSNTGSNSEDVTIHMFAASSPLGGGDYFVLTGTENSISCSVDLFTGTTSNIWLDQETLVSISATSSFSNTGDEWCIQGPATACVSATFTTGSSGTDAGTFTFFHLVSNNFEFTTSDGSPPSFVPNVSCNEFGLPVSTAITLDPTTTPVWCDQGATASMTPFSAGNGLHLFVQNGTTYTAATSGNTVLFEYWHQYALTFSYAIVGGGSPTGPTLSCTSMGAPFSTILTGSATTYWCDALAPWSVGPNPLAGSASDHRWMTPDTSSGTVNNAVTDVFTYFHQLNGVLFTIDANAQVNFDTVMYATIQGKIFGAPNSALCTVSTTAASTDTCTTGWIDDNQLAAFPEMLAPGTSSCTPLGTFCRWENNESATQYVGVNGLTAPEVDYWKQWSNEFAYALDAGQTGTPTIDYYCTQYGVSNGYTLTTILTSVWCDNGSHVTTDNPSQDSTTTERFFTLQGYFAETAGGGGTTWLYYHQFALIYSYTVIGGGVGYSAPNLNCTVFDVSTLTPLTTLPPAHGYWCDQHDSTDPTVGGIHGGWSVTNPLTGSLMADNDADDEQWATNQPTGPTTVTASENTVFTYYNQWAESFAYTTNDGSTPDASSYDVNAVQYCQFGVCDPFVTPLRGSTGSAQVWVDAGNGCYPLTSGANYNFFYGGSDREDWAPGATSSPGPYAGCVDVGGASTYPSSPITVVYYHQFLLYLSYSITAVGTFQPTPPTFTCEYYGSPDHLTLSMSPRWWWCDAGSGAEGAWSVTNPLGGSNAQAQWAIPSADASGHITGYASPSNFEYYYQYWVTFYYNIVGGGSGYTAPTVTICQFQFGGTCTTPILASTGGTSAWADVSTTYTYTNPLTGSVSMKEQWVTTTPSGTIGASTTIKTPYQHQWWVTIATNNGDGTVVPLGSAWFNNGAKLKLMEIPLTGFHFIDWTKSTTKGSIVLSSTTAKKITATIDGSGTITAHFS